MADKPVILSIFPNSDTKIYVLDPGLTLGPLGVEHSNYLYFLDDMKNQNFKIDFFRFVLTCSQCNLGQEGLLIHTGNTF